jgi:hypothetical protein
MSIPKKVKAENEWPLGKLKPVTFCINGSEGLTRLKIYFTRFNTPAPLTPIAIIFKETFVFFLKKRK